MYSRINSTGRLKVGGDMVMFVVGGTETRPTFDALIDLSGLPGLPQDGRVYVEAHRQNATERFDFGTVAQTAAQELTELRELTPDSLQFRVKVVDAATGKLLARGDRFTAGDGDPSGRTPLLPVRERPIGDEPWRTAIEGEVVLILNEKIPDAITRLKTDRLFQALILPAAFRQVLLLLWVHQKVESEDSGEDDWCSRWLRFVRSLVGREPPAWDDDDDVETWIDDACLAFSSRHGLMSALTEGPAE